MSDQNQIVAEKTARLRSAINMESLDRVPVVGMADFWPVNYSNKYTMQEAFYNIDVTAECYNDVFSEWNQWDAFSANLLCLGPMLDATGSRRWTIPGKDISAHADFQHPDLTVMDAEEYSKLTKNPMTFIIETIIPRLCRNLDPSNYAQQAKAWAKTALYLAQLTAKRKNCTSFWAKEYGIPALFQGGAVYTPVDLIADQFRGFREGLIDIKQRPEEVQAACEAIVPFMLGYGLSVAPAGGDFPLIFNPQHTSPFMSPKDYEKVYWPTFKKLFLDGFVERGYKVWTFLEGNQEQHLERLQDLPKGKIVAHLESTDMVKAKKYLGGRVCIAGGMPVSLLAKGTTEEVRERTKSILKLFEDEPGFIMTCDSTIPGNAKPENIHVWLETVRQYGHRGGTQSKGLQKVSLGEVNNIKIHTSNKVPGAISCWEEVKAEFGKIEGEEKIIKEKWEELEQLCLPVLYSLIR